MGLAVTAYSHLKHLGLHYDGDWCDDEDHIHAHAYDTFPQSFRGLPVLRTRVGTFGDRLLEAGCYETTPETESHDFHPGSYSRYGWWRENLQAQFNPERDPDGPFYELIWFADNEGSIGPEAAKDLVADFQTHSDAYQPLYEGEDRYGHWLRACELAAADGLIHFH